MRSTLLSLGAAAAVFGLASAPRPAFADDAADPGTDLGPSAAQQTVTASLVLKVRDADALERFVAATQDPGDWRYHRFLSVNEFVDRFAPSDHDIKKIKQYLGKYGITVDEVYADNLVLHVTGTADAFNQAFSADLHDYTKHGHRFHRPHHNPSVPVLLRDLLLVVDGLNTEGSAFHPLHVSGAEQSPLAAKPPVLPQAGAIATGVPGSYTVGDLANLYDVNPLYAQKIDGKGRTVGIATLASFVPDDAYQYWSMIGLDVKPDRITQVHVDGGGEVSSAAGSGETSLDVEQAGGLAPKANVYVYDAPNTDQGFIDVFYKAASDNIVDSLSVSWGSSEVFYYAAVGGTDRTLQLQAFHQAFLEGGAQGISLFASAGDGGAYDVDNYGFDISHTLTVLVPGSDPALTSAGGTTVPVTLDFGGGAAPLVVPTEQVWGWDYIESYFAEVFGFPIDLFSTGGGGGVSIYWARPEYQKHTAGVRATEAGQSLIYDAGDGSGPQDLMDLPAGFAGRNLPDVSLDADPESGYLVYSSTDGGLLSSYGGTSFVAPQLDGLSVLLAQSSGGRIGLWNPMLYRFHKQYGYGPKSPFRDITAGDNWFYAGVAGYEPGAGLGVLDVANFAAAIQKEGGSCHW